MVVNKNAVYRVAVDCKFSDTLRHLQYLPVVLISVLFLMDFLSGGITISSSG